MHKLIARRFSLASSSSNSGGGALDEDTPFVPLEESAKIPKSPRSSRWLRDSDKDKAKGEKAEKMERGKKEKDLERNKDHEVIYSEDSSCAFIPMLAFRSAFGPSPFVDSRADFP